MGGTSSTTRHGVAWLIHACHRCHQGPGGVESDRRRARDNGWLLGPGDDATLVPVWLSTRYGVGWWFLDDEGCYRLASNRTENDHAVTIEFQHLPCQTFT